MDGVKVQKGHELDWWRMFGVDPHEKAPTMDFRWLVRRGGYEMRLQQRWVSRDVKEEEWRDVPRVEEDASSDRTEESAGRGNGPQQYRVRYFMRNGQVVPCGEEDGHMSIVVAADMTFLKGGKRYYRMVIGHGEWMDLPVEEVS